MIIIVILIMAVVCVIFIFKNTYIVNSKKDSLQEFSKILQYVSQELYDNNAKILEEGNSKFTLYSKAVDVYCIFLFESEALTVEFINHSSNQLIRKKQWVFDENVDIGQCIVNFAYDNGMIDRKACNEVLSESEVIGVLNEVNVNSSKEEKSVIYHTTGENEYYKEYLKDSRWGKKREEIKGLNKYTCQHCFNVKILNTLDELKIYIDDSVFDGSSKIIEVAKQVFNGEYQTMKNLDSPEKDGYFVLDKKNTKLNLNQYYYRYSDLFDRMGKTPYGYLYSDKEEISNIQIKREEILLSEAIPYKKKEGIGWTKTLLMIHSPEATTHGQILLRSLFRTYGDIYVSEYTVVGQLSLDEYSIFFPLYNLNKFKEQIDVHHLKYGKKEEPWNVPNDDLITLCHSCHMAEHDRLKN